MSAAETHRPRSRTGKPWLTAIVAGGAILSGLWPGSLPWLEFDRGRIEAGEFWRLWTAHLAHYSPSHLGWNLAVFVPAGFLAERASSRRARLMYLVAPALISVVLLVFDPLLFRYAGLSALAAGTLALLAFTHLGRTVDEARWIWCGVLVLLGAKIALELILQEPLVARFSDDRIRPVPLAHVAGFACAALVHGSRRRFHV